jgi:HJR/Mrr/RecB family endonuclease
MTSGKKNKLFNDVVDFFYSISIYLTLRVWQETQNIVLAALTFGVSLGLLYVGIQKYKERKRRILFESGIDKVENMSGIIFEEFLLEHFKHLGYTGYLTPRTENYGADLVLQKDEIKVVVQSKRWKSNVGADAIEQVIKAVKHYDADKGMVVTNSFFTEGANELANSYEIELWDRMKLVKIIDLARGNIDKVSSVTEIKHNIEV